MGIYDRDYMRNRDSAGGYEPLKQHKSKINVEGFLAKHSGHLRRILIGIALFIILVWVISLLVVRWSGAAR